MNTLLVAIFAVIIECIWGTI